jgi:hypothetical protein
MGLLTQEDPIGIAGGLNLYGFAGGDPINFSDPFGLMAGGCCLDLAAGLFYFPLSAHGEGSDVVLSLSGGGDMVRSGGTRAWRNNNPGNLRNSAFSRNRGSLGEAGNFAVFGAESIGTNALVGLLNTSTYQSLSLDDAIERYAPASENDTQNYQRFVQGRTGVGGDAMLGDLTSDQIRSLAGAIRTIEGWREGTVRIREQ